MDVDVGIARADLIDQSAQWLSRQGAYQVRRRASVCSEETIPCYPLSNETEQEDDNGPVFPCCSPMDVSLGNVLNV